MRKWVAHSRWQPFSSVWSWTLDLPLFLPYPGWNWILWSRRSARLNLSRAWQRTLQRTAPKVFCWITVLRLSAQCNSRHTGREALITSWLQGKHQDSDREITLKVCSSIKLKFYVDAFATDVFVICVFRMLCRSTVFYFQNNACRVGWIPFMRFHGLTLPSRGT